MSDQRAWYQDGWTIITLIVLALLFGQPLITAYQKSQQSTVPAQFRVKLVPGVLTGPKFEVFV